MKVNRKGKISTMGGNNNNLNMLCKFAVWPGFANKAQPVAEIRVGPVRDGVTKGDATKQTTLEGPAKRTYK